MFKSSPRKMLDGCRTIFKFLLLLAFFCHGIMSECAQVSPCLCTFSNGQGYDLTELGNASLNDTKGGYTFYFHPCTNTPLSNNPKSECSKGVSLCAKPENGTDINLGKVEDTKMVIKADSQLLMLHHNGSETSIRLICCESCNSHLVVDKFSNDTKKCNLFLESPYACKITIHVKGLSIGSILVILLIVFSGIYFIGGAAALKLLRGATGWEMLPNHGFWSQLPSLVRDGIVFTGNCFRVDSYDRI